LEFLVSWGAIVRRSSIRNSFKEVSLGFHEVYSSFEVVPRRKVFLEEEGFSKEESFLGRNVFSGRKVFMGKRVSP
jgi:hypothetical protein